MNSEFTRLNQLYSSKVITPEHYFTAAMKEYGRSGDTFSLEQVDVFSKQTKEVGLEWKPNINAEEGKIAGVLNQLTSGIAEGFTTVGWADDPDTTVEGLANKIGHLVGFAPDIVAGVLSFGASVPVSAVKRATAKSGLLGASKTWSKWLEKGAEQVPLLSRTDIKTGKLGLRSIPLRVADFVVDNAGKRLGNAKLVQTSFLTRGLANSEGFKHIAEESARLGVALAVSARKEGPEGWAEAAMHGAMAGAFFGGLGRYVYLGKLLGSGNKAAVLKATKEIRNTADDLSAALDDISWELRGTIINKSGRTVKTGRQSPQGQQITRQTKSGAEVKSEEKNPLHWLSTTEEALAKSRVGGIKKGPVFKPLDVNITSTGQFTEEQIQFMTFMVKGGLGSGFTGGMATMQRAPLPDQVYEYLLGFFFGAASRPRGESEAREWLLNKGYTEMNKQALNQYPLKPEVVEGRLEYHDKGFIDFDYKKIEGYSKLDVLAKDYLQRWEGNRVRDMFNKKMFPQALNTRIANKLEDPKFAAQKEKRGDLKFLQDVIKTEVERYRAETVPMEAEARLEAMLGQLENTDINKAQVADNIQVYDINGLYTQVEIISKSKDNVIKVRDLSNGNVSTLDAKDGPFTRINAAHKDYVLDLDSNIYGKTDVFDKLNGKKVYDLTLKELRDLTDNLLATQTEGTLNTHTQRLLNAIDIRANQIKPLPEQKAKMDNQQEILDTGSLTKQRMEEIADNIDLMEKQKLIDYENRVAEILEAVGVNERAKSVIRNLARAEGNVDIERFWYGVEAYLKTNKDAIVTATEARLGSMKRDPNKPLNEFSYEYYNKDGKLKTRKINPRKLLQEVYFKERGMYKRKSYKIKVTHVEKGKNWGIEWDLVPAADYNGKPLQVTSTESYWNTRMRNTFGNGEFERIISHEMIPGEYGGEKKVRFLQTLSKSESLYAINLMLAKQLPANGGPRYISGFNPSNGELITIPYAQDVYKIYNNLSAVEIESIARALSGVETGSITKNNTNIESLKDIFINQKDNKLGTAIKLNDVKLMYEKVRLSNFIYAAEIAGYLNPAKAKTKSYLLDALKKYIDNPLFPNVAKATKYIKTFYNGVPLQAKNYGDTTFTDGKGKVHNYKSILNEEGGATAVILNDHLMPYTVIEGGKQVTKYFELTDGTKYYNRSWRERILLESGRIDPTTKIKDYDAYIKDVILVPENMQKNRGLLINKGAEDAATKAIYDLMDKNGWDVMIYKSGQKSNSRHEIGDIEYNKKTDSWSVTKTPEKFTIKPEDIRVIPHEVEVKRDGSAPIHWGLMNKISDRMTQKTREAFSKLISNVTEGDVGYIHELTNRLKDNKYEKNQLLSDGRLLDIDKLSMPFVYDVLSNNLHSPLARDIIKNLFKSNTTDVFETTFGREGVEDISSLNAWLEQIDYNPYGLLYGNKASAFNSALNNILINKLGRPIIKRGFTSLRLKGYDPETEAFLKKQNGKGVNEDEFYLYEGDYTRDIEYRDIAGEIEVGKLGDIYKIFLAEKKKNPNSIFTKTLEEDLMYVITRSPQADEAGIATLKFGGFINKAGRGIVVHKKTAERLGGADYDGDMVAGYQSIDPLIKQEFRRDEFAKMHTDSNGNIKPLKNPDYNEKFGIELASDGKTKEQQVYDVFDPEMKYTAGYQAIQGQKDIGLDVNASQTFRRVFDSIYIKEGNLPINKSGSHSLIINPEFAGKLTKEQIWEKIRDERTTKQNNSFDALDYIKMASSEEVSAKSFFEYFSIVDRNGKILKPGNTANEKSYLNSILPVKQNGELDFNAIFDPGRKTIQWKLKSSFFQQTGKEGNEGNTYRQGDSTVGYQTLKHAYEINPNQVFSNLHIFEYGKTKKGKVIKKRKALDLNTNTNFKVIELNKYKVKIAYEKGLDSSRQVKTINLKDIERFNFEHNYFRALEALSAAEKAFNGNKANQKSNKILYDNDNRMSVLAESMKEVREYFPSDSVQNKIATEFEKMGQTLGHKVDFNIDVFKGKDINNLMKNVVNAYANMQDSPLFKYLLKEKFIHPESDPLFAAGINKGISGAERASIIIRAINIEAEKQSTVLMKELGKRQKFDKFEPRPPEVVKNEILSNHIRRAQFLVDANEIYIQLESRLSKQGVSGNQIQRMVGNMVEDVFVGKQILRARYNTTRMQSEGNPHIGKWLRSQYKKLESTTNEAGEIVTFDQPTQEVFKYLLHKMLLSEIVPGEKGVRIVESFDKAKKHDEMFPEFAPINQDSSIEKIKKEYEIADGRLETEFGQIKSGIKESTSENKLIELEKMLSEGVDDAQLNKILADIPNSTHRDIAAVYRAVKNYTGHNTNLFNSEHIPMSHKTQIIKDLTQFIDAAESYGKSAKEYVTEVFKSGDIRTQSNLLDALKKLKKSKEVSEKDSRNREAKKEIEDSIQSDLVNTLKNVVKKKAKKQTELEREETDIEKKAILEEEKILKEDLEIQEKDQEIFNEFEKNLRDKINKKVVVNSVLSYGSENFTQEIHNIYKRYNKPTALAVAKKAIRSFFDKATQTELYSFSRSKPLDLIEDIHDPSKPVVETKQMAEELGKLEKMIDKNPDLLVTIEGLMTELSSQIGWVKASDLNINVDKTEDVAVQNVAVTFKNTELIHMEAFNRFVKDMYISKGSLLDKIKNKFKKYGQNEDGAKEFRENLDKDTSIPPDMKSIYHLLFNEFVGQKLRTHEMELYEKRNVPVFDKNGSPVVTNRTLTLPTSTLEMVRTMVDQGKTLNTALSGFAEKHLKETFEFINPNDSYLMQNFRDIFKQAIRVREYDPETDKNSLHFGDPRYGGMNYDSQSKKYIIDSYKKAQEYLDKNRMNPGEVWPDSPNKAGFRKFSILDPKKPGKKKNVDIDEIVEIINDQITNFYEVFKDNFIMKNFRQQPDGEFAIRTSIKEEIMGANGFIDVEKLSAKLDLSTKYSGANIKSMLSKSTGLNEVLFYQYEYGLMKTVQADLAKEQGIKPRDVNLNTVEARDMADALRSRGSAPMVNIIVDGSGRPSSYWSHNGHSRYASSSTQLELYIQERLQQFDLKIQSEKDVLDEGGLHSKLFRAAQMLINKGSQSKVLAPYRTWESTKVEMLKDKRNALERGIVSGQREDGGYSEGIAHMIQSRNSKDVFSILNGSMKSKDELIMPGYDKSYEALTTYHKNFLKTYIDNLVGFRSHLLIDKFEQAEKLGEHTNAWSGYMRDALTNMLGMSTFRTLEIQGMKKTELPLLKEYIKAGLDRSVFSGRLKYEEKQFLDKVDAFSSPEPSWIQQQAKKLKDDVRLDDAITDYRINRLEEFAKKENVNKIKRFGTAYNVFSDEVVVNTIRSFETRIGKSFGLKDFTFFKSTKGLTEDSRRMALAQRAKAVSNFEGKWELLSLLSHPKTLITNMLGGGINIYSDVGIGTFMQSMSEKDVLKAFEGAEYQVIEKGKIVNRKFRNMKDVEEWIESLGILDSMFTEEVGMNRDIVKFGNNKFVEEVQEQFTNRLNETPGAKTNEKLYDSIRTKTVRELSKKYQLFDQVVQFGGKWMQYSERKLRRTAFLAHYLNARQAFGSDMLRHMTFDNAALIEISKKGVEASQFMYHSAFRSNYSNTAMGRIMTRFHPYAWNSIKRRKNLYKYGAKYTKFIEGTAANKKFERQFTADLMSLALANIFIASIFEYALSPPMNWMQDMASLTFGDAKERERAFFSQWPHPYLAPLQIITPPAARYVLPPINSFLSGDWESFVKYQSWTYLPFGRALRDATRIYDSPAMLPDFATGIPLHRMHEMRRESIAEKQALEEAENTTESE